jgi:hypothetical protein
MIIVRSPLRITLGGGGTDLPSYYREHEGFLIAAAIDKFIYVTVIKPFTPGIYLKYSKIEHVEKIDEVHHPIVRESLKQFDLGIPQIEIRRRYWRRLPGRARYRWVDQRPVRRSRIFPLARGLGLPEALLPRCSAHYTRIRAV